MPYMLSIHTHIHINIEHELHYVSSTHAHKYQMPPCHVFRHRVQWYSKPSIVIARLKTRNHYVTCQT